MHILFLRYTRNNLELYTEMCGVEGREQWQGIKYIPPRRRISDISYAHGVGKKYVIHAGQDTAALNSI
jgi:hypothetical protein